MLAERAQGNSNFFTTLAAIAQGKFLPQTGADLAFWALAFQSCP